MGWARLAVLVAWEQFGREATRPATDSVLPPATIQGELSSNQPLIVSIDPH